MRYFGLISHSPGTALPQYIAAFVIPVTLA
jgi:hypothetical protein